MTDKLLDIAAPAWHRDALCAQVDPDPFFPEKGGSVKKAKAVCANCPVSGPDGACLKYALDHTEEFGVWGGYTEDERRQFTSRKRRGARRAAAA